MPAKCCQYGNCLEQVSDKHGISVTLRTKTFDGEQRAIYCCAAHAAAALMRLALDRREPEQVEIPSRWRTT